MIDKRLFWAHIVIQMYSMPGVFVLRQNRKNSLKKKGDSLPSAQNDKIAQDSTDLTAILGLIKINKGD
jgi:hypothetical protein